MKKTSASNKLSRCSGIRALCGQMSKKPLCERFARLALNLLQVDTAERVQAISRFIGLELLAKANSQARYWRSYFHCSVLLCQYRAVSQQQTAAEYALGIKCMRVGREINKAINVRSSAAVVQMISGDWMDPTQFPFVRLILYLSTHSLYLWTIIMWLSSSHIGAHRISQQRFQRLLRYLPSFLFFLSLSLSSPPSVWEKSHSLYSTCR